jgi:hypothetical protein
MLGAGSEISAAATSPEAGDHGASFPKTSASLSAPEVDRDGEFVVLLVSVDQEFHAASVTTAICTGIPTPNPRCGYASLSIAAGVSLFELSRLMGTSPAMLDKTYGHMLPDALDRARSALDAFVWGLSGDSASEGGN